MKRLLATVLLLLGCASMQPARAAVDPTVSKIVDILATALGEPELKDALPMIDCVRQHGPVACANLTGMAESEGKKAIKQFVPTDPLIQSTVSIIQAAYKNDWLAVLELTGTDVLFEVACHAGLTAIGPLKGFLCDGPLKQVSGLAKPVVRQVLIFAAHPSPKNFLAVVEQGADPTLICALPVEFPGKPELCGALGELVQLGKDAVKLAGSAGKALWYGAGDVLGLNDPKAISQEDYYALAWAPWYHAGTVLCLRNGCKGIGDIAGHVWHPCKDYFASHDMTSSTAQDACDNMRDRKFYPQVKSFAKLMPAAADAYVEVARPLAKMYAVTDYGSTQMLLKNKATLVQGCVNKLALGFPFPPPDPAHCEAIRQSSFYNSGMFSQVMHQAYSTCLSDAKKQLPSPTAWASACDAAAPKFVALLNEEAAALQQKLPGLAAEGCLPPQGWNEPMGIELACRSYTAYQDCLGVMSGASNPQAHCAYDQQKADKDIVSKIMAALGHKRCKLNGTEVECARPWKKQKCLTLRAQLTSGAPTTIQCKDGPPADVFAFAAMTQEAKNIVFALNGGAANEKKTTGGLIVKPLMAPKNHGCKTTWDPLAIGCSDPKTSTQVPGHPNFGPCPPTLSADGVDAPCLRTSLNKNLEQTASAKEQRTPGLGKGPAPHSDVPVRLGTSRPGVRVVQHGAGTTGRMAGAPARPSVTVSRANATVEGNCRAPAPAVVVSVALRNSGGPLAANQGTVYVKELGGAGLTSGGVHLPAIGAGRTTPALRIPLITARPYSSLAGRHELEVMLEPSTTDGKASFDKPLGRGYTLYVDVPAGHCQDRPQPILPKQSIKLAPPERPLIRR